MIVLNFTSSKNTFTVSELVSSCKLHGVLYIGESR